MKFEKHDLCHLDCCYAVSSLMVKGQLYYIFATDDVGFCYAINASTGEKEVVWEKPGGTMSIIPLQGRDGEFLATVHFYPGFRALTTKIVHVKRGASGWEVKPWLTVPYLHRFDLLTSEGQNYLFCCIFSGTDEEKADFSNPGSILVAPVDAEYNPPQELQKIAENMPINHGYFSVQRDNHVEAYTACENGVYHVVPPTRSNPQWVVEKLMDCRASDVAVYDIDGDGVEELAVVEPFHGDQFVVYKWVDNHYQEVYRHDKKMAFIHAVWGGKLAGTPTFLCGCRGEERDFFALTYQDSKFVVQEIEKGYGPSNVAVLHGKDKDTLLVANREENTATLFFVSP